MKLRPARSFNRPQEQPSSHERPDDLYALFEERASEAPAADTIPPESDATAVDTAEFSLTERLARFEQPVEPRLAELTISRRSEAETSTAEPAQAVIPPADKPAAAAVSVDSAPAAALPLLNELPLPSDLSVDAARCAMTALRAAARLAPILLLPRTTRIDTRAAARMLQKLGAHALAQWIEAWGRRPVIQTLRASANRAFDGTLVQHLLADQLSVAMASDALLAQETELLNRMLGAKTPGGA
jgi:hypothetical protein